MLKDVDEVRFIIENSFEDIKVERIRLIGSGNDCHAYEINGNMTAFHYQRRCTAVHRRGKKKIWRVNEYPA